MELNILDAARIIGEDYDPEKYEVVYNECIDNSGRWTVRWACVFTDSKHPGKYFMLEYDRGATENQYLEVEDVFGCYSKDKLVTAQEVQPVQKTITVYEKI